MNNYCLGKQIVFLILVCFALISCSKTTQDIIPLKFESDLIPEGIAVDKEQGKLFINSLSKSKIVRCNLDGSHPTNFINSNQYGYLPGFGMTIKEDTLYALGNTLLAQRNKSVLLLINKKTGDLIKSYTLNGTESVYLNDIAISSKGIIFITDSQSNKVYTISKLGELKVFMASDKIAHSNGISISGDDKYLFLASFKNGIRILDIASKQVLNKIDSTSVGIDGMKFYKNSLIGIVNANRNDNNNGVYRFFLNDEMTSVIRREKLISYNEHFSIPTTFDIINDTIFFVINSQLDNFNQETNEIIDQTHLKPYYLMRKKIE